MSTSKEQDRLDAGIVVVTGGPNFEHMTLGFRGILVLNFPAYPLGFRGHIDSWGHLSSGLIPHWVMSETSRLQQEWLWVRFKHGVNFLDEGERGAKDTNFIYCAGPQSQDRWGLLTINNKSFDCAAAVSAQISAAIAKSGALNRHAIIASGYEGVLWLRESAESMKERESDPMRDDLVPDPIHGPDNSVMLNFNDWSIGWKTRSSGMWLYRRLPVKDEDIITQACTVMNCMLKDCNDNTIHLALKMCDVKTQKK